MFKYVVILGVLISSLSFAAPSDPDHVIKRGDELTWVTGPDSLPKGAMIAILYGDPASNEPFAFRLKFPDKYHKKQHLLLSTTTR